MKTLVATVVVGVLLLFAPGSARAQSCCGESILIQGVSCPVCGNPVDLYQCNPGGGNDWMAEGRVNCGPGPYCYVNYFIPAGYCYDLPRSPQQADSASAGTASYVNAFVKDCKGQYVALQLAIGRQAI